jgi:hypothetical protein
MDITSLILIVVIVVAIYLFIKFVVSPVVKIILGIIIFLILIYLLQRFFGFNLDQILTPFGISLNLSKWNFNWILESAKYYTNQAKIFLNIKQ